MESFTLIYKIDKSKEYLRILGKIFYLYNRLKFIIIYKNKKFHHYKELIQIRELKEEQLKLKIIFVEKIKNLRYMFENCISLLRVSQGKINNKANIYKHKIYKHSKLIYDSQYFEKIFIIPTVQEQNCSDNNLDENFMNLCDNEFDYSSISKNDDNLDSLSITCWKNFLTFRQKKYISFFNMFFNCPSLISLPDISEWDTSNVNNMSQMFFNCSSLISLPDISKWDASNATNMSGMFSCCSSLISLPDISKWDTNNVNDMSGMFCCCSSLISLPDISKWDTSNVTDMSEMFFNCSKLEALPDIFKWNTSNVIKMNYMFSNCSSLSYLPDISNWVTNNVNDMFLMFSYCNNLLSLPNIFYWKINNDNNTRLMLYNLSPLLEIQNTVKDFNIDEEKKLNLYEMNQVNFKNICEIIY